MALQGIGTAGTGTAGMAGRATGPPALDRGDCTAGTGTAVGTAVTAAIAAAGRAVIAATAAAITTTTTAARTAATATTTAVAAGFGLVDAQGATHQFSALKGVDGPGFHLGVGHLDKGKSPLATGVALKG